jgi:peptidyl-prolyl cis-trans isomerase D
MSLRLPINLCNLAMERFQWYPVTLFYALGVTQMRIRPRWTLALAIPLALAASSRADTTDRAPLAPIMPGSPMVINALMGSINGTPVFVDDILRPINNELHVLTTAKSVNLENFRRDARELISRQLEGLIDDVLMESSAQDVLDAADKQRIDIYMNRVKKEIVSKYGGVESLVDLELQRRGSSLAEMLQVQRRGALRQLFMQKMFDPKIQVTREQVLADYNLHIKDKYTIPAQIEMFTITLPLSNWLLEDDPNDNTRKRINPKPTGDQVKQAVSQAMARAHDLIKQLNAGADFATLASDNSRDSHAKNGGRWAALKRGELSSQAWEDLAFGLKPNTIGEPILINGDQPAIAGVVITKVGDVTPGHIVPFADAQADIKKDLHDRQANALYSDYIRSNREKAAIEAVDRMIDTATDAAVSRYISR